jgi:Tfp pilus assembly protein PilO
MKQSPFNLKQLANIYAKKYPDLFKLQERQKFLAYLYLSLTLFAISFFGIFAILPTVSTISTLKKQYADNQATYENLKTKLQNLQSLDTLYRNNIDKIALVNQAIPVSPQIASVTKQIETIANNNNLALGQVEVGTIEIFPTASKNPPLYGYTIQISTKGSSDNINHFIADIINFDRIVAIQSITSGIEQKGISEVNIIGKVYFYAKK